MKANDSSSSPHIAVSRIFVFDLGAEQGGIPAGNSLDIGHEQHHGFNVSEGWLVPILRFAGSGVVRSALVRSPLSRWQTLLKRCRSCLEPRRNRLQPRRICLKPWRFALRAWRIALRICRTRFKPSRIGLKALRFGQKPCAVRPHRLRSHLYGVPAPTLSTDCASPSAAVSRAAIRGSARRCRA
jgi:hypothetical protein